MLRAARTGFVCGHVLGFVWMVLQRQSAVRLFQYIFIRAILGHAQDARRLLARELHLFLCTAGHTTPATLSLDDAPAGCSSLFLRAGGACPAAASANHHCTQGSRRPGAADGSKIAASQRCATPCADRRSASLIARQGCLWGASPSLRRLAVLVVTA